MLDPDKDDSGETPRPSSPSVEEIFNKEDPEADVLCRLDSEIDAAFDPDGFFSEEDLEVDVVYRLDSKIDSVLDPVKVDSGETPRLFASSVDDILMKEDLEVDVLCLLDSEIDSVFDPDDFHSKEDFDVDVLCLLDAEIESVLDPDKVDSRETPRALFTVNVTRDICRSTSSGCNNRRCM